MNMLKILILEDDERLKTELSEFLQSLSFIVYTASRPSDAIFIALEHKPDIALIDIKLPEYDGLTFLKKIRERNIETEAIIMSGHGDMDTVIEALRAGAFDYLRKPFSTAELHASLMKTERYISLLGQNKSLEQLCKNLQNNSRNRFRIVGTSPRIADLQKKITQAASANISPVLITGESGTGKELIARNIHLMSPRSSGPFIAVNCAAIPRDMFESELFGHEKGAFTDAKAAREGLFRRADKGTLFLDEIGEIPPELQGKLLRAIETQSIRPVGSDSEVEVSVRIISATNVDLVKSVNAGSFRSDLFYRIAVLIIEAPPLREHPDDIPVLAKFFNKQFAEEMGHKYAPLPESVLTLLASYQFPGNVRELKNIIERYCILGDEVSVFFNKHTGFSHQAPLGTQLGTPEHQVPPGTHPVTQAHQAPLGTQLGTPEHQVPPGTHPVTQAHQAPLGTQLGTPEHQVPPGTHPGTLPEPEPGITDSTGTLGTGNTAGTMRYPATITDDSNKSSVHSTTLRDALPTLKLDELERLAVETALAAAHGVHTKAAQLLGISRQALERRLQKK